MFEKDGLFSTILISLGVLAVAWVLIQLNKQVFKNIKKSSQDLHIYFFERLNYVVIVIVGVLVIFSVFGKLKSVWRTMLGGTAIISAVVAFAAQDIIKDVLAGLMISIHKPFEIGNRIELENGMAGIVKDITMRHVALNTVDAEYIVIPNSKLNAMTIKNHSYHIKLRSVIMEFPIAYHSDVRKAMELVRKAVIESDYTVPGKSTRHGMEYAPVYFISFEESSLKLLTTVYYDSSVSTQTVQSDMNTRVKYAFDSNKIEIPFRFVNVVSRDEKSMRNDGEVKEVRKNRDRTKEMMITGRGKGMDEALNATEKFGTDCQLSRKEVLQLRLLSEEVFGMIRTIIGNVDAFYWIERERKDFKIHLKAEISMTRDLRDQLMAVSTSGKNSAIKGFMSHIKDMISVMLLPDNDLGNADIGMLEMGMNNIGMANSTSSYRWSMQKYINEMENRKNNNDDANDALDELEKSIVASIADEITIGIEGNSVEMIIFKDFDRTMQ